MTKTPDETKKGLADPIHVHYHPGDFEPRLTPLTMCDLEAMHADALALIQQLEAQNVELSGKIGQLQAEREMIRQAFCNYVPSEYRCDCCKHSYLNNPALTVCPYYVAGQCDGNSKWEYYGIKKEN